MKHFLNTLALTFISFSGRFVFAMQKHYFFFCERSSNSFCLFVKLAEDVELWTTATRYRLAVGS